MSKGAGAAPDYQGAAQQQGQNSQQNTQAQTLANRPNVNTPFGFQGWKQGPGGEWTMNSGFSGGLGTGASALGDQAGQALSNPLDPSLFGGVQSGDQARDQAITGAYNQATSRLDPQWAGREQTQASSLANSGLDPNSEAYRNSMRDFGQQRNDAYGSAMNSAIGQGTQAGQATFNENVQANQLALANALKQRSAPLDQMGQLQGLLQTPGFNQAGKADTTQNLQATEDAGNWQMQDAQMQNQFWGQFASGLMGAAGNAAKFSDERLKQDIRRLSIEAIPGVPFASWEWKHNPSFREVGVIAQDLQKVAPHLVSEGPGGFLMVDYSFLKTGTKD